MRRVKVYWRKPGGKKSPSTKLCARSGRGVRPVGTPGYFANPYAVEDYGRQGAIERFRQDVERLDPTERKTWLSTLNGYSELACYCETDEACHVDVILEFLTH